MTRNTTSDFDYLALTNCFRVARKKVNNTDIRYIASSPLYVLLNCHRHVVVSFWTHNGHFIEYTIKIILYILYNSFSYLDIFMFILHWCNQGSTSCGYGVSNPGVP